MNNNITINNIFDILNSFKALNEMPISTAATNGVDTTSLTGRVQTLINRLAPWNQDWNSKNLSILMPLTEKICYFIESNPQDAQLIDEKDIDEAIQGLTDLLHDQEIASIDDNVSFISQAMRSLGFAMIKLMEIKKFKELEGIELEKNWFQQIDKQADIETKKINRQARIRQAKKYLSELSQLKELEKSLPNPYASATAHALIQNFIKQLHPWIKKGDVKGLTSLTHTIVKFMCSANNILTQFQDKDFLNAIQGLSLLASFRDYVSLTDVESIAVAIDNLTFALSELRNIYIPKVDLSKIDMATGTKAIQLLLLGKDIGKKTMFLSDKDGNSIEMKVDFYKDFPRGDYFLNGQPLMVSEQKNQVECQYKACKTLENQLGSHQAFDNLTRLMFQGSFVDLLLTIVGRVQGEGKFVLDSQASCRLFDIQIKGSEVQLTIYFDQCVFDHASTQQVGYIAGKKVITISKEDLAKNWEAGLPADLSAIAPSLRVEDHVSDIYSQYKPANEVLK